MKRLPAGLLILVAAIVAARAADAPRVSYGDRYSVLSDRNIFLRDRSHPTSRSSTTGPSHDDPDRALVLRGIVFEDGGFRAYVENINTNEMMRLSVGDALARGKIGAIDIDAIAYDAGATPRAWIAIGTDLTGAAAAEIDASTLSMPTTTPSGLANVNPNDPNLTMEQRLKLRRMQELKGK